MVSSDFGFEKVTVNRPHGRHRTIEFSRDRGVVPRSMFIPHRRSQSQQMTASTSRSCERTTVGQRQLWAVRTICLRCVVPFTPSAAVDRVPPRRSTKTSKHFVIRPHWTSGRPLPPMPPHGDLLRIGAFQAKPFGAGETRKTLSTKSNMCLDMYLYRSQFARPSDEETITVVKDGRTTIIPPTMPAQLTEEVGSWRKANQIHGWFVDNVQNGEDDCREYDVTCEHLRALSRTVDQVLSNSKLIPGQVAVGYTLDGGERKYTYVTGQAIADPEIAQRLLPTRNGFFFGSCDYDAFYREDLRDTQSILAAAFASPANVEFSYQSSW